MQYNRDMLYISQMENGEKLYHYTSNEALINIISNKELWITKWDYLNDVNEFMTAMKVCEEVLCEEQIKSEIIEDIKNSVINNLFTDNLSFDYYILSFSCDNDSQLLWSNYSDNDGINLEIDFEKFCECLNYDMHWHGLVNYRLENQKECFRKAFYDELIGVDDFGKIDKLSQINDLKGRDYDMTISHISVICQLYSMFFKKNCFEGEREYRFVFSNTREKEVCFRNKNNIVTPFLKEKINSLDFITGITIGPTNKMDIAEKGIKQFLQHHNMSVDVTRSQIPLRY